MRAPSRSVERQRLRAALALALPWYGGFTLVLWIALAVGGMAGLPAMILAMSTLSTSGILPRESLGAIGYGAELLLFTGMALSVSRALTLPGRGAGGWQPAIRHPWRDREVRLAVVVVGLLALIVVARHWLGAFESAEGEDLPAIGHAAWGAVFTGLSFLSTTGFVSHDWIAARGWSGLTPPGLVLMGLTLIGGGVATTAGGVKLLRIYALSRLGRLELNRMIYPSIVHQGSELDRFLASHGARSAWLFAMVFAIVAVALIGALMVLGETLESGLIFAVAALTTTGPLVEVAGVQALHWWMPSDPARLILAVAMILGRLEILVILALALAQFSRD
jgi:trk system potassium uptake protein TrkH